MKIHYDNIIFSLQKVGGISTYWGELSKRLVRDERNVKFHECPNDNLVREVLDIKTEDVIKRSIGLLLFERFKKVQVFEKNRFVFHSSYNRTTNNPNARSVCTVHDFVHERFYSGLRKIIHSFQKGYCIKNADKIIAISESTKRDLIHFFPDVPQARIKVIYNGVSDEFYPLKLNLNNRDKMPYLLFIGSREHYKNFLFCVDLMSKLANFNLFIVGSSLKKKEIEILDSLIPGRWSSFRNVTNMELNELYNQAFALLYPSSYEGFGIPILEAMKAGCPFIALNASSIPEVAGDAGVLVDRLNVQLFLEAIETIKVDRDTIIKKGFIQSAKFSWEKCYQETLCIYEELNEQ